MQNGMRRGEEPHVNSDQVSLLFYGAPSHFLSFRDLGIIDKGLWVYNKDEDL